MGFYFSQIDNILNPLTDLLASAGRPARSTELEVGGPSRSTDVHKRARQSGWRAGRLGRSTVQRALLSGKAPVDRTGRPDRESALCIQATVDRPVDRWLNGQNSDRWLVDRAVDRQANLAPNG